MLEKDATIGNVKHEVLYQVAKHVFAGDLEEKIDEIPYDMIPGPQANFRCCVYREREIIRQRIRLAQGKCPTEKKGNKNIVQTITAACEGCPITRFVVTDNCQKCMSKKCQQACNFNAISMLRDRADIDPKYCKECGKCSQACPYNAIADLMRPCKRSCPVDAITMDENNIVQIDEERCIHCGACIKDCPFGAISDRSFMVDVIQLLLENRAIYAMVAPAIEGQFGTGITMESIREGVKQLGFTDMYEVALGADMVAESEAKEWNEAFKEGKKMTTSCCPAFVNMVRKHFPQLIDHISTTVSPMAATARWIKEQFPDAITVFIGPCIAKKSEVLEQVTQKTADYALTFDELAAMFKGKGITLQAKENQVQQGSIYGKQFASAGGVTGAVLEALKEMNLNDSIHVRGCSGALECKKALMLLKAGRLPEDFIEGMACEGGCVNGPGSIKTVLQYKKDRDQLLSQADTRTIRENLEEYVKNQEIPMHQV